MKYTVAILAAMAAFVNAGRVPVTTAPTTTVSTAATEAPGNSFDVAAMSNSGAAGGANGDAAVVTVADTTSGSAAASGETAALAGAGVGIGIGFASSEVSPHL